MTGINNTLICIDFINEIVGADGKLAKKGYHDFVQRHSTLTNLRRLQDSVRSRGGQVIFVNLSFKLNYLDCPKQSPLLGGACNANILLENSKSVEVHQAISPIEGDLLLTKNRISAFHDTGLNTALRSIGASKIMLAGVSTDLAVESAARDAHDLDYEVEIVANCCAAACDEDHDRALSTLQKFARISG